MPNQVSCPFVITREFEVVTAFDSAGQIADAQTESINIYGTVSGEFCPAEIDVGLGAGFDDIEFVAEPRPSYGELDLVGLELTDEEYEVASQKLMLEHGL